MPKGYLIVQKSKEAPHDVFSTEGSYGSEPKWPAMSRKTAMDVIRSQWGQHRRSVPFDVTFQNYLGQTVRATVNLKSIEAKFVK